MNLVGRLFALLPRRKPKQTCGTMLLWGLPHAEAEKVIEALLENSVPGMGADCRAPGGESQAQTGDYLKLPDWL